MKKGIIRTAGLMLIVLFAAAGVVFADGSIGDIFSPINPPASVSVPGGTKSPLVVSPVGTTSTGETNPDTNIWAFRLLATVPEFRIVQSVRKDALLDLYVLSSAGGAIAYENLSYIQDGSTTGWYVNFSASVLILLSGTLSDTNNPLDSVLGLAFGFFDNKVMLGVGYDFGVVEGRSRILGLLSYGFNFNNK